MFKCLTDNDDQQTGTQVRSKPKAVMIEARQKAVQSLMKIQADSSLIADKFRQNAGIIDATGFDFVNAVYVSVINASNRKYGNCA